MGIHEMKGALLQEDLDTWKPLVDWLEQRSGSAGMGEGLSLTPPPAVEVGEGARG
jgi:hypothetical protein